MVVQSLTWRGCGEGATSAFPIPFATRSVSSARSRRLTIVECRPPWREDTGTEWTRFPIARLRYSKLRGHTPRSKHLGWAGYFRYGNSALLLGQIRNYALRRLALWLSKRGNRRRAWGWGMAQVLLSPNQLGLINLEGIVVPPRPFRDWRAERRR